MKAVYQISPTDSRVVVLLQIEGADLDHVEAQTIAADLQETLEGSLRRMAIAKGLATDPRVIDDEPTTEDDPIDAQAARDAVIALDGALDREIARRGKRVAA